MNCENCAKELSEKINYCPYCGYDLLAKPAMKK